MKRLRVSLSDGSKADDLLVATLGDDAGAEDVASLLEHAAKTVRSAGLDVTIQRTSSAKRETKQCGE
jgi:hypothetical protein